MSRALDLVRAEANRVIAEAEFEYAKAELDATEFLAQSGSTPAGTVRAKTRDFKVARARLTLANAELQELKNDSSQPQE